MSQDKTNPTPIGVQKYLKGMDYPARKEDLLSTAQKNGAPRDVTELLEKLPGNKYDGPDDVMRAYGEAR